MVRRYYLLILGAFLMCIPAIAPANDVPSGLVGSWRGSGRIIVSWSQQKQLAFELVVQDDGRVTGRIGDARFKGKLTTRPAVMRWLGNGEYMISGSLEGPIIAAEGIARDRATVMLSRSHSRLTGGMHTAGSKAGGEGRMVLSVVEVSLDRTGD